MKEQYQWNYTIKIKTKEGTFEYEKPDLSGIDLLLEKHPSYEEVRAEHNKPKSLVKKPGGIRNAQNR